MNENDLFKLYEKLYFHEIDMREKINSRLQLPLAMILAELGFLAYMLKELNLSNEGVFFIAFIVLFGITIIILCIALWNFIRSWYGYDYDFLPAANETEKYRNELVNLYNPYPNSDELVSKYLKQYIYRYYAECSSKNTGNNDTRSLHLHYTNKFIVISFVLAVISFIPFFIGNLGDELTTTNIVKVEVLSMPDNEDKETTSEAPPPPTPPPKRVIKEGVEITETPKNSGGTDNTEKQE